MANRRAKQDYFNSFNSTLQNSSISAKNKFKILLKLTKSNKKSVIPPLIEGDETIHDSAKKANTFSDFFEYKSTLDGANETGPNLEKLDDVPDLAWMNTDKDEVKQIFRKIKQSNFSPCGISGEFLAIFSDMIAHPFSVLLNRIILFEGYFPKLWKIAHITPVYKRSGSKVDKANYRPISLLPTLSKVCESIIHKRLLDHCITNKLISDRQAAYLKGDSTVSQLVYLTNKIRENWGYKKYTQIVWLDISSAFDKVWHSGLLSKLKQIGVTGKFLEVIESYLSGRQQVVVVEGTKSSSKLVTAGVPQGSCLGPLLFILYINSISEGLESEVLLFADDSSLIVSGDSPSDMAEVLNRDLTKISNWASNWKITFNPKKTKTMFFIQPQSKRVNSVNIYHNDVPVKEVFEHKHLGVILTPTLDWSRHIHEICTKAYWKLSVLRRISQLKRKTLNLMYKLTVRSVIEYALIVIGNNIKVVDLNKLNRIQYTAAKIVTGALHLSSRQQLEKELGWETIQQRIDILSLNFFHKIHSGVTRPLIKTCMTESIKSSNRSAGQYKLHKNYGTKHQKSFFPHYTKHWNKLSEKLRRLPPEEFKTELKAEMLKPKKYLHCGSKLGNKFITWLRVGQSYLNSHSYSINKIDSPSCSCGNKNETVSHFIISCNKYNELRQHLFTRTSAIVPNFLTLPIKSKLEILLYGQEDLEHKDNRQIQLSTQNFILQTNRFRSVQK